MRSDPQTDTAAADPPATDPDDVPGRPGPNEPAEGEPWHPYEQSDPAVNGCDHCGQDRRLHP